MLTITEMLREHGVVGKFVEFYGEGVAAVPLANRATIGNMSPEFGSTCAMFPIDEETIDYLRLTGRSEEQVALVEAYAKEQGLWHDPASEPAFSEKLELDLSTVVPVDRRAEAPAGPGRSGDAKADVPQGVAGLRRRGRQRAASRTRPSRVLPGLGPARRRATATATDEPRARPPRPGRPGGRSHPVPVTLDDGSEFELDHGAVAIAAITSCTNTSNPQVMIGAALLARNAVEKGLDRKPWVKTTLAPG